MTEEEYFRKTYPDSCYGDRPLSPHWDFFQDGVEFGERQSEKKIEELEKQIEKLKNRNAELKGMYAHSAREAGTYKQFFEKEKKENAELKEQIKDIKNCLEEWFKYENERDYELNVDELLIETQQLLDKEIENV